jgi:hypothetical protein
MQNTMLVFYKTEFPVWVENLTRRCHFRRPRGRLEDNIKMNLKEIRCEVLNCGKRPVADSSEHARSNESPAPIKCHEILLQWRAFVDPITFESITAEG